MGPVQLGGIPAHPLFVHAVVVLVPLATLLVLVAAVWPAARRRLGPAPALVSLGGLVAVPLATHAGSWLYGQLGVSNAVLERHAHLGGQLLPWVAGLLVVSLALWLVPLARRTPTALTAAVAVVAVLVAVGAGVQTYRVGDSGSRAVWQGVGSSAAR